MNRLGCGCFVSANAIAYCPAHSEGNPPAGWRPDQSRAEQAPRKAAIVPPPEAADETLPALRGRRRRQVWNPASGKLKDIE